MIPWTWRETAALGSGLLFLGVTSVLGLPIEVVGGTAIVAGAAVGLLWPKKEPSSSMVLTGDELSEYLDQTKIKIGRIRNDLMKKFPLGIQQQVTTICNTGDSCRRYIRGINQVDQSEARQLTEVLNAVENSLMQALPLVNSDAEDATAQLQEYETWLQRIVGAITQLNNELTTGQSSSLRRVTSTYDDTLPVWGLTLKSKPSAADDHDAITERTAK